MNYEKFKKERNELMKNLRTRTLRNLFMNDDTNNRNDFYEEKSRKSN